MIITNSPINMSVPFSLHKKTQTTTMWSEMLWFILATLVAIVFYKLWKLKNFWKDRNVPSREPVWFFGDLLDNFLGKRPFIETMDELYNEFPNTRYFGLSQTTTPVLIIKDPELLKLICIKDFDHFPEHQALTADESIDPLWARNVFASKAEKWRELRLLLGPTFTSSKIKLMFVLMDECAQRFVEYFKKQEADSLEVELKDLFSRFTNDVIATTAFGIECNSVQNRNNEFYLMGKDITNFSGFRNLKLWAMITSPLLMKLAGAKVFPKESAAFFVDVVAATIKERVQKNIVRPDLINLLLEVRRNNSTLTLDEEQNGVIDAGFAAVEESVMDKDFRKKTLSDDDIYAQCLLFFTAGFGSVADALTFAIYELALNTDIQERLRQEIDQAWLDCKGKLNYDTLTTMKYMDLVISETFRKWPPVTLVDRRCVKPYIISPVGSHEKPLKIEVGQILGIPIRNIHLDEKNFAEPQKFDPERFNENNKHNIKPGTYLPFGMGLRGCTGSRFAILEMKTLLFHLLRNFETFPGKKTQIPLVCNKAAFNFVAENGTWVDFKRRQQEKIA